MNNYSTPSTKIILVRHGRSTYNEQGRYQGSSDKSVLTEKGSKAAFQTGLALKNYQFDAIYSSPLKRVQQTTQEITKALKTFHNNLPAVTIDRRLKEVKMGAWEGLPYAYVKEHFSQEYACWKQTPHLLALASEDDPEQQFYPLKDLYQQAKLLLTDIITKHRGQTVLIVAHGGTNRALISTGIGLSSEKYQSLQQSNCGISCLEFPDDGSLQGELKWLNVTNHLGEYLPKLKEGKTGLRWLLVSNKVQEDYHLQQYLEPESINLVVSDRNHDSQKLANTCKQQLSQALRLSINHHNFLDFWHHNMVKKQQELASKISSNLITGLIVAEESLLESIAEKLFQTKLNLSSNNSFSVIHYPSMNHHPILQGLLPIALSVDY
ncbi:Fructose-2,6-bisphosphatase [Hyella patelloides LEGE 07179]|uniref:Fructose-2,6-bisphosphatase n=1 Tax=Hyella patelloides LEGE 07179 TaxID=945734 RepID=A0A563VW78_9CYAN|nr:histidine phosphatase family protein [Hyella patelloides]VEP15513.1 Fructose-2,6-bisphosphatase [Hyella patelloides LEGE 07179]